MKLHSFTKIIHAVCLEHFGAEDVQKGKNIRQREKGQLRIEQRLLKKQLKEMPNERELVKKQLSKGKDPCHCESRKHKEATTKETKS